MPRPVRRAAVVALLTAAVTALVVTSLLAGTAALTPGDLLAAATGHADGRTVLVLVELRLPRLGLALAVGAALGAAGSLFQSATRNPLGSPDVVGFTTGAATGALLALVAFPGSPVSAGAGAALGGLAVAVACLGLGGTGHRLVLVGIGLAAFLTSVNSYLLTRADATQAQNAAVWLVGTLNGRGDHLAASALLLAGLLPLALLLTPALAVLETGDAKAASLGVSPALTRWAAVAAGVGLTATAVSAAGPVAFVALAAPHLARRLTGVAAPVVAESAAVGAALLLGADLLAQRLLAPQQVPVGAATGVLGGLYLAVVLSRRWRREP